MSSRHIRAGWIIGALPVLFLAFDIVGKLLTLPPVVRGSARLGYAESAIVGLGLIELACLTAYLIPRTAVLGAVLLTGFLGGAVATHVRIGDPLFSHILFPVYVGALIWAALFLRDERLRALVPVRQH
jgi:hypothetical protein